MRLNKLDFLRLPPKRIIQVINLVKLGQLVNFSEFIIGKEGITRNIQYMKERKIHMQFAALFNLIVGQQERF
jgi:hypothetical protein